MLLRLIVKNFALIADVDMGFHRGMNIITGETGAGKSILIGALGLALGKRADTSALRDQTAKCVIEAEFDIKDYELQSIFRSLDLDYEHLTIFRREITPSGKSRAFINDTPVNLSVLQEIGAQLIEIHSQRDNIQLFTPHFQYQSLDVLTGCLSDMESYTSLLKSFKEHQSLLEQLKIADEVFKKESDYHQFLVDELEEAQLDTLDESAMHQELELLTNAEELIKKFGEANQLLEGSEWSLLHQLHALRQLMSGSDVTIIQELDSRIKSVMIELEDIGLEIQKKASSVAINPERMEELNEKSNVLFTLKNKHHVKDLEALQAVYHDLSEKLNQSNALESQIEALELQLADEEKALRKLALHLSKLRQSHIPSIESSLQQLLAQMGMQHSIIRYQLTTTDVLNAYGCNDLKILLSSDKGQSYHELKKAASGGELARINLSFKQILAHNISLPSSIFDEIDTGVSGEIARKVGCVMKTMAEHQQVIVITHLPQIASLGHHHMFVYKAEHKGTIHTQVRILEGNDRIHEIAKMISGDNLTEHAIEQSKALLS